MNRAALFSEYHNIVQITGKLSSDPRISVLPGGRRIAQFSVMTREEYLDAEGNVCTRKNWHRMNGRGRIVTIVEELCECGTLVHVEGKLVSRFMAEREGLDAWVSEVEVNDINIM